MPTSIDWLVNLSKEEQEKMLESLANTEELCPIEVDGVVYHIPTPVAGLIDSLWLQLQDKKPDISGIEKN